MKGVTKFAGVGTTEEIFVDKSSRLSTWCIQLVRSATVSSVVSWYKRGLLCVALLVIDINYF